MIVRHRLWFAGVFMLTAPACSGASSPVDPAAESTEVFVDADVRLATDDAPTGGAAAQPVDSSSNPVDSGTWPCDGVFDGSYAGDDAGDAAATIDDRGAIVLTFLSSGAGFEVEGSGQVAPLTGEVTIAASAGSTSTGKIDPITCRGGGTWTNPDLGLTGTWEVERTTSPAVTSGCAGEGVSFQSETLFRADFRRRDLRCADFSLAELAQPDFTDAVLDNASFRGTDLEEPIFIGVSLRNADFRGALLTRAQFVEADLTGADLQIAVSDTITFVGSICPDGTSSDDNDNSCL